MIDIDKHKKTKVELTTPKGAKHVMSEYEISRWFSMIEAVDIIDQKANQLGIKGKGVNWVKPIAIQKYIDERTESMLFEVKDDLSKEKRCTT
jgi:hypothetical protein